VRHIRCDMWLNVNPTAAVTLEPTLAAQLQHRYKGGAECRQHCALLACTVLACSDHSPASCASLAAAELPSSCSAM
jgi:hypothetical protein